MPDASSPIRVRVLFFAMAQELAGTSQVDLELAGPTTAADVETCLAERYPWLGTKLTSYRIAVDREFASADAPVVDGAEVAIIPPVSGG